MERERPSPGAGIFPFLMRIRDFAQGEQAQLIRSVVSLRLHHKQAVNDRLDDLRRAIYDVVPAVAIVLSVVVVPFAVGVALVVIFQATPSLLLCRSISNHRQ